jgi:ribosomal protein L37AE/L43A
MTPLNLTLLATTPQCPQCNRPLGDHNRSSERSDIYYCYPCQQLVRLEQPAPIEHEPTRNACPARGE